MPRCPSVLRRVAALDEAVTARVLRVDHAGLDHTMRLLSSAADHSKVWVVVAAGLTASGRRPLVEGAGHGLVAAALSSLVVNQGLKRALPRRRPVVDLELHRRRVRRVPRSGSFPSGHAASAAAFSTGVALRAPLPGAVLTPVAAGVAVSRVWTGVHHASDVLVGWLVGASIGAVVHRLGVGSRHR